MGPRRRRSVGIRRAGHEAEDGADGLMSAHGSIPTRAASRREEGAVADLHGTMGAKRCQSGALNHGFSMDSVHNYHDLQSARSGAPYESNIIVQPPVRGGYSDEGPPQDLHYYSWCVVKALERPLQAGCGPRGAHQARQAAQKGKQEGGGGRACCTQATMWIGRGRGDIGA